MATERPGSASYFAKKLKILEADDATSDLTKSIAQFDKNRNFSVAQVLQGVRVDLPRALQLEKQHLAGLEIKYSVASGGSSGRPSKLSSGPSQLSGTADSDTLSLFSETVKQRYSSKNEAESCSVSSAQLGVAPWRSVLSDTRGVRPALRPLSASTALRNVEIHTPKSFDQAIGHSPTQKSISPSVRPASASLKQAQQQLDALLREEGRLAIEAKQRTAVTSTDPSWTNPSDFLRKLREEIKTEELTFGRALDAEITEIADDEESFDTLESSPPRTKDVQHRLDVGVKLSPIIGRPPIVPLVARESGKGSPVSNELKDRSVSPASCCSPETTRHSIVETKDNSAPSTRPSSAFVAVRPPLAAVLVASCEAVEKCEPEEAAFDEARSHPILSAGLYAEKFRRKLQDLEQPRLAPQREPIMRDNGQHHNDDSQLGSQAAVESTASDATPVRAMNAKWSDVFACSDPSDMIRIVMDDILYASPFLTSPSTREGEDVDSPVLSIKRTQQEERVDESDDEWDPDQPAQQLGPDISTPPPMKGWTLSLNSPSHSFASNGVTANAPPQLGYTLPPVLQAAERETDNSATRGDDFVATHFFSLKSLEEELAKAHRQICGAQQIIN